MPIDEIAVELFKIIFRFIIQLILEVIVEFLIKGPGYLVLKIYNKENKIDIDDISVILFGTYLLVNNWYGYVFVLFCIHKKYIDYFILKIFY